MLHIRRQACNRGRARRILSSKNCAYSKKEVPNCIQKLTDNGAMPVMPVRSGRSPGSGRGKWGGEKGEAEEGHRERWGETERRKRGKGENNLR